MGHKGVSGVAHLGPRAPIPFPPFAHRLSQGFWHLLHIAFPASRLGLPASRPHAVWGVAHHGTDKLGKSKIQEEREPSEETRTDKKGKGWRGSPRTNKASPPDLGQVAPEWRSVKVAAEDAEREGKAVFPWGFWEEVKQKERE